jgi:hypothetical protein
MKPGETQVWSVVGVPDEKQEDACRLHREMERLKKERGAHSNRIKSLLVLHGIRLEDRLSNLADQLGTLRCWNAKPLPEALCAEIRRELERYCQVCDQLKDLEKTKADSAESALLQLPGSFWSHFGNMSNMEPSRMEPSSFKRNSATIKTEGWRRTEPGFGEMPSM